MAVLALWFGGILILLGVGGYLLALSGTALIPAGFGAILVVLGLLARRPPMRMHAMHGAALVSLIGFGVPAWMLTFGAISGSLANAIEQGRIAPYLQGLMALVCLVFLGLCIKSFIDARRQRKQEETAKPA